jgi:hypothetical protein
MEHAVTEWFRQYATSRNCVGSRPDEASFFIVYIILPASLDPGVCSAINRRTRNIKIMFLGCKARTVGEDGNLIAICEAIVYTMWEPKHFTIL